MKKTTRTDRLEGFSSRRNVNCCAVIVIAAILCGLTVVQAALMVPDPLVALRFEEGTGAGSTANLGSLGGSVAKGSGVGWYSEVPKTYSNWSWRCTAWAGAPSAGNFTNPAMDDLGIAFWAKRVSNSGWAMIAGTNWYSNPGFAVYNEYGNYRVRVVTTTGSRDIVASNAFGNTDWHHYAFSYDSSEGTAIMYIDGELAASSSSWTGTVTEGAKEFTLFDTVGSNPFYGYVDSVYVFDQPLTPVAVQYLMNTDKVPEPASLVLLVLGTTGLLCRRCRSRREEHRAS